MTPAGLSDDRGPLETLKRLPDDSKGEGVEGSYKYDQALLVSKFAQANISPMAWPQDDELDSWRLWHKCFHNTPGRRWCQV